jgi:hypothetical protein
MNITHTEMEINHLKKEAEQFIAGGVVSLNRKVDPHIIFRRGKGSKIMMRQEKSISIIMRHLRHIC